jgi:DNA-binding MarR family transcriptional regulator
MDDLCLCSRLALPDNEAQTFLLIAKATRHGGGLNANARELAGEMNLASTSVEDALRQLIARKLIKKIGSGKKATLVCLCHRPGKARPNR